jgi:hypothetical protein
VRAQCKSVAAQSSDDRDSTHFKRARRYRRNRLVEHRLAEFFHEWPHSNLGQGVGPPLGGAGFEILIESKSLQKPRPRRASSTGERDNI